MPEEKVIKTLIYGVKSSGNQSACMYETACMSAVESPEVYQIVQKDLYVDDWTEEDFHEKEWHLVEKTHQQH